jgi:hypothetical protein
MTNRVEWIRKGLYIFKKSEAMKDSVIVGLTSGLIGAITIEFINIVSGKR